MPTTKGGRGRGRGRGKASTKASTISTTHLPAKKLGKKMVNCEDFLKLIILYIIIIYYIFLYIVNNYCIFLVARIKIFEKII